MFDIAKHSFDLPDSFLNKYKNKQPDWDGLGFFTYKRTYARIIEEENRTEEFWETCQRVVEGIFSIQKNHCEKSRLPWDERKAQRMARRAYESLWEFKWSPPGRGLWAMGTKHVEQKGSIALNNCAFRSTRNIDSEFAEPFCFLMDVSMLGTGCGFDTRGATKIEIQGPAIETEIDLSFLYNDWNIHKVMEGTLSINPFTFHIHDTREGWVASLRILLNAYFKRQPLPQFDYSKIRIAGKPIKGFGGISSGPEPLIEMHQDIASLLDARLNQEIRSVDIVDIMNLIGKAVVAGNVRRSAELALGEANDKEFILMKQDHDALMHHRWASNNSILAEQGMDYQWLAKQMSINGEPGIIYLENSRAYGRMKDPANWKDKDLLGYNPCQPSWATVMTPDGMTTIGNINIGDSIWSGTDWTKVTNKWSTGVQDIYEYHTRAGSFIGTKNHKVVSNGKKVEIDLAEDVDTNQCKDFQLIKPVEIQYIVDGLVLGDGTVHKASNNLTLLCIGKNDQDYFESEIASFIGEHRPGIHKNMYEIETNIHHSELPKTYNRIIPDRYRFAKPQVVSSFLRGLYSANGSIVDNRVTLKASSLIVIKQAQEMLSGLGIKSYYTTNRSHEVNFKNGVYECRESYDLNITTDRALFADIIGFIQEYKTEKLKEIININSNKSKTNYEIVSRKYLGKEEVFDLTVESDKHTYWTGGLLVSNCSEQGLEDGELCTLVETYPSRHDSLEEYLETLKIAYLYGKTVTLVPTHIAQTNAVMTKNRRIGLSQSGIIAAFVKHGRRKMLQWCDKGYEFIQGLDIQYSNWLGIPRSIKTTTVKPSGTVSLLAKVPPGIHYPHSRYYIRRVRVGIHSPLWQAAKNAGYKVEAAKGQEASTMIVEFPIKEANFIRGKSEVSIWEQVSNAVAYQKYWSDNAVSITTTVKSNEKQDIQHVLEFYEDSLKTISFLPLEDHGYVQAPYESISEKQYKIMTKDLKPIVFDNIIQTEVPKYCDGDKCEL